MSRPTSESRGKENLGQELEGAETYRERAKAEFEQM